MRDIDTIRAKLEKIALEDGKISDEEQLLIHNTLIHFNEFNDLLAKASADGIITHEEAMEKGIGGSLVAYFY